MKKPLAAVVLTVGNTLLTLALGNAALLLFGVIWGFGIAAAIVLLAGHIVGAMFLQRLYQKREWLSPVKFWLCAAVPSAVISAAAFGAVMYLDSINYFSGFLAGLGEFMTTFACLIYSGAFLIALGTALCIKYRCSTALCAVVGAVVSAGFGLLSLFSGSVICLAMLGAIHIIGGVLLQCFLERITHLGKFRFWALFSAPVAVVTGILYIIETLVGAGRDPFSITFLYSLPAAVAVGAALLVKALIRGKTKG